MIIHNLGMPYMGSKRKLAKYIVDLILDNNPNVKYVYDLFGGGGAISFEFLQRSQIKRVIYNELNTGVCELLKDILKNGVTEKYNQWIDRKTFMKHKNDNDWFGGLCKVIWSFGNRQIAYLFGKDIENIKKEAHLYLFENGYKIGDKEKRIRLIKQFKNDKNIKDRFEIQQLEQLEILNLSYEEVKIETPINETIIYLDPPYKNTAKYQKDIDHDKLNDYIRNSKYKIYLSSYESEFYLVESKKHRCLLSATAKYEVVERNVKYYLDKHI